VLDLFQTRSLGRLHPTFYRAVLGAFALASFWEPGDLAGPARGRALEKAFYKLCAFAGLRLTERAGSRTLRGVRSASGLQHESDAVIGAADVTLHVEMKSLFGDVPKNDLMLFNQKGIDFILSNAREIRSRPCYRLFLTTTPLSFEARRFAAIWGIAVVEPGRLPLAILHWLVGSDLELGLPPLIDRDRAWIAIPKLLLPLQAQLRRVAMILNGTEQPIANGEIDTALQRLQAIDGAAYWAALDRRDPFWLERVYESLAQFGIFLLGELVPSDDNGPKFRRGLSRAPRSGIMRPRRTEAVSALPRSTPGSPRQNSTASIRRLGSPTYCAASPIIPLPGFPSCCRGIGADQLSKPQLQPDSPDRSGLGRMTELSVLAKIQGVALIIFDDELFGPPSGFVDVPH
jgi:hypothetical protein